MIKTKEYNNLDVSKFIPKEHRLVPGKKAMFKIANLKKNRFDPGAWIVPNFVGVPQRDRIVDDEGNSIQIAAIKGMDVEGKPIFADVFFLRQNMGFMVLDGNSAADVDMFEYMYICNYNTSNKRRDKAQLPIFEFVDPKADARKSVDGMNAQFKASQVLHKMSKEEVLDFAAARGWVHDDEEYDIALEKVMKLALEHPEEFLTDTKAESLNAKTIVNRALNRNIIHYSAANNKYAYTANGDTILIVPKTNKNDRLDFFTNWLLSNERGKSVYEYITERLQEEAVEVE